MPAHSLDVPDFYEIEDYTIYGITSIDGYFYGVNYNKLFKIKYRQTTRTKLFRSHAVILPVSRKTNQHSFPLKKLGFYRFLSQFEYRFYRV